MASVSMFSVLPSMSSHVHSEPRVPASRQLPFAAISISSRVRVSKTNISGQNSRRVSISRDLFVPKSSASRLTCYVTSDGGEWLATYSQLKEFYDEHQHCSLPEKPETPLSVWVRAQRHNMHEGLLTDQKKKLLNDICFDWESGAAEWNGQFDRVKEFLVKNNANSISRTDDPELGMWLSEQRAANKKHVLSKLRAGMLQDIGVNL
uniref:Helicase-associated domain-containing protein n=1 Tax=Polyblepharides amylifera TaxID=1486889 RepID=A0A7R9SVQ1_9CHLO|mmetsp:Transcript_75/g.101  ORF Transcript_75/g.101 Transcript_75/m.101 type:complete len:206 (+) Transcript_75:92-709(+)|eukprot:CAMPEP_0196587236 /NCGR_PEP_ID=MMETSP1081-20130531/56836_1 /TAXON_ID=36882 /ORGANISM="Pyramimonas amylifera, Strain CCMP720" /LENGTH=205 /DNA_ID=CAMNT_0041909355 /DNA_START=77 /DNA_END=694 /DNA_ORIENTATION=+